MSDGARLHHLDALRALTMVLILPAHAVVLVGLQGGWNDVEASIYWAIHVFRLPLFFLVAGFFAALLLDARGTAALARNRAIRIGIPLTVGVIAAAPLVTLEVQSLSGLPHRPEAAGPAAFADPHPSYLWFLWYLALIYASAMVVRHLVRRTPSIGDAIASASGRLLSHWAAPLLLAVPAAFLLYRQPTWIADAPSETFLPRLDLLAYYAIFFATGWLLFSVRGLRSAIEGQPWPYVILAGLAFPPALALYLLQSEPVGASSWFHLLALLLLSVSTWSLVFGLLGVSRRFLREPSARLRYWADASYWIYLSHFPVMAVIAIAIFGVAMPEALRLAILVLATMALIYPAYGAFVRHTAIGRVLHGPRPLRTEVPARRPAIRPAAAAGRRA